MNENAPSIFLSHAHEDKDFARRLAQDLVAAGARVWIDEAEILLGDSLIAKISEAIDVMDYLAVVLSPTSVQSEWVRREVEIALNGEIAGQTVKVLPLLLSSCDIPPFLRGRLYADFTGPDSYANSFNLILERLGLFREPRPKRLATSGVSTGVLVREQESRQQQLGELAIVWHHLAPGYVLNKTGLRNLARLLSTFSAEEVLYGMEQAANSYLIQEDDDSVTAESWELAFSKIGAICRVQRESRDNPGLKDLYYIRGIMRKQYSYVDEILALNLLKEAHTAGADIQTLRTVVHQSSSWTRWRNEMLDLIRYLNDQPR
ncbi:MAG: toll/interleukin-1 receptor domain-containing protein [Thermoanaerobaculia bacterium]